MKFKSLMMLFIGALFWLMLVSALQRFCVINIPWHVERLWTDEMGKNFVKNMVGDVAFHVDPKDYSCNYQFIYSARYYPNGAGSDSESVTLTDVVDIDSWREIASEAASTTYSDRSHEFVLYNNSDGVYMGVFDK
jgi:hypothetical protein